MRRLWHLVTLQSAERGIRAEDAAIERDYLHAESVLWGGPISKPVSAGEEEMMIGGDYHYHEAARAKGGGGVLKTLLPLALAAGLGGGGVAAGAFLPELLDWLSGGSETQPVDGTDLVGTIQKDE